MSLEFFKKLKNDLLNEDSLYYCHHYFNLDRDEEIKRRLITKDLLKLIQKTNFFQQIVDFEVLDINYFSYFAQKNKYLRERPLDVLILSKTLKLDTSSKSYHK